MWHRLFIVLLFLSLSAPLAQAAPTTPTADFTDNNDGTVMHKTTVLTWKRCAEGMTWTGATCTGTAQTYTWAQATALTASFAGKSDWRLPTIRELSTITEVDAAKPAINTTIFPNTPASYFWSASAPAYASYSGSAWEVNFYDGGDGVLNIMTYSNYVRLVRGGQPLGLLALSRPTTDYAVHGDGTVTHTPTALTWKRCAEGQTWSGTDCSGTAKTYTWDGASALSTGGWRLPTQAELRSLVDYTLANPSINNTIFPTSPSYFWSASAYADYSGDAWNVFFHDGSSGVYHKTDSFYVRLVRGEQSDCLFNWAEKTYPQYFSPAGGKSQTLGEYYYRQYAGNIYLATSSQDNHGYYYAGGQLGDLGLVAQWYAQAGCQ